MANFLSDYDDERLQKIEDKIIELFNKSFKGNVVSIVGLTSRNNNQKYIITDISLEADAHMKFCAEIKLYDLELNKKVVEYLHSVNSVNYFIDRFNIRFDVI